MTDTIASPAMQAASTSSAQVATGVRISEIDMLRGLVIVLMALDHTRDYFFTAGGFSTNPLDPAQTTPWLYATRWITHLCAPTFVFLAGVSAYLQFAKGKTAPKLSMFLLTRGLWLIALELTVLSFGWSFAAPWMLFMQVIWAIGWSMIVLAGAVWLPRMAVLAIGVAIVAGHNLLDPISPQQWGSASLLWQFLHEGGPVFVGEAPIGILAYPILPWFGVIALGYGMGAVFMEAPAKRDRTLLMLGLAMIAAFLVLRGFDLYGNPYADARGGPFGASVAWQDQPELGAQIMGFMDVQKYPPSLHFVLATLGIVFTLWPLLARVRGPVAAFLTTFGAVPFFFYVLHIYLIHVLAIAANAALGRDVSPFFNYLVNGFTGMPAMQQIGFSLPWVYAAWIVVLALLYPLCRYWQQLKARRRDWWLSYL
ncbi:MAG: DUF1624 domain-containing protein [Phycisphaerales bacterium]|nr:DUF1624 domain-containing protein [Hyphomonadaceae bacterium]